VFQTSLLHLQNNQVPFDILIILAKWSRQFLLEQKRIMELVFFIHYTLVQSTPTRTLEILTCFAARDWGLKQVNLALFDGDARAVWKSLVHLCVIVSIEVLNIEEEEGLEDPRVVMGINEIIERVGGDGPHGVLLLAWSCWLQRLSLVLNGDCSMEWKRVYDLINGESVQGILLLLL
jgi:hypothetical protein